MASTSSKSKSAGVVTGADVIAAVQTEERRPSRGTGLMTATATKRAAAAKKAAETRAAKKAAAEAEKVAVVERVEHIDLTAEYDALMAQGKRADADALVEHTLNDAESAQESWDAATEQESENVAQKRAQSFVCTFVECVHHVKTPEERARLVHAQLSK